MSNKTLDSNSLFLSGGAAEDALKRGVLWVLQAFIKFEENDLSEALVPVYTNAGRKIAGQTICKVQLTRPNGDQKLLIGVASLSQDDNDTGKRSYFEGRKLALERAITSLPRQRRTDIWEAFLSNDDLNGKNADIESFLKIAEEYKFSFKDRKAVEDLEELLDELVMEEVYNELTRDM